MDCGDSDMLKGLSSYFLESSLAFFFESADFNKSIADAAAFLRGVFLAPFVVFSFGSCRVFDGFSLFSGIE